MDLLTKFTEYILQEKLFHVNDRLLLAVSGGVDSVVLCELCNRRGLNFSIAHCNFNLRGDDSKRDEAFVKNLADHYKVPFFVKHFDTTTIAQQQKKSIEEAARDLRYEWFQELIKTEQGANVSVTPQWIVTAHHANDTIETILMHFFRGTGIRGVRGILPKHQSIVRPLLFALRADIEQFANENNLSFVVDSTNAENEYTRNYFRNNLIPSIKKVFPKVEDNILHNAQRFGDIENMYHYTIEAAKKKVVIVKGEEIHLPVLLLQKYTFYRTLIWEILKEYGYSSHQAEDVVTLLKSESGKWVDSSTHRVLRNRKWLIVAPKKIGATQHIVIESVEDKVTFHQQALQFSFLPIEQYKGNKDTMVEYLDAAEIQFPILLRKWKQGDYFYPLGMDKKKKLSKFFIDNKLSLNDKENVWVLEMNKKIIYVVGMRIDNRFKISPSTKKLLCIQLHKTISN